VPEWAAYRSNVLPGVDAFEARMVERSYDRHSHATYSIGVTDEGVQAFRCRGADHASTSGIVLLFNPEDAHDGHAGSFDGFKYRMLYVEPDVVVEALGYQARPVPPLFRQPLVHDPQLTGLVGRAHAAVTATGASALERDYALRAMLSHAVRRWSNSPSSTSRPTLATQRGLSRVKEHLRAHLADDVTVAELAEVAAVSRAHLARSFRAAYGQTLHGYQRALRLGAAAELLAAGQPPGMVAAATGFVDQAHLTRRFKSAYGLTPGTWRSFARGG
jgi:AraC-like DNA-binding protein